MFSLEQIENLFGYHKATEETAPQHTTARQKIKEFAQFLNEMLPDGRAKSTAFTKLDEVAMWAHKAISETAPVVNEALSIADGLTEEAAQDFDPGQQELALATSGGATSAISTTGSVSSPATSTDSSVPAATSSSEPTETPSPSSTTSATPTSAVNVPEPTPGTVVDGNTVPPASTN